MLDAAAISAFLEIEFPQIEIGRVFVVDSVGDMAASLRLRVEERHLRPGGTVSGPTLFALADVALYVAILGQIGRVKLAVTTNLNINFLRMPPPTDLVGEARLLKLGRRLAVGQVTVRPAGGGDVVAHATGTYSLPDRGKNTVA